MNACHKHGLGPYFYDHNNHEKNAVYPHIWGDTATAGVMTDCASQRGENISVFNVGLNIVGLTISTSNFKKLVITPIFCCL